MSDIQENLNTAGLLSVALQSSEDFIRDESEIEDEGIAHTNDLNVTINNSKKPLSLAGGPLEDTPNTKKHDHIAIGVAIESEKLKNTSNKRLGFIQRIFESICIAASGLFKKIQSFIATDMKSHSTWYAQNESKYGKGIRTSEVTLKIRLPRTSFKNIFKQVRKDIDVTIFVAREGADILAASYTDSNKKSVWFKNDKLNSFKKLSKSISIDSISEKLYGSNRITMVTAKEFFSIFPFENLTNSEDIKTLLKDCVTIINLSTKCSKNVSKIETITDIQAKNALKNIAVSLEVGVNIMAPGVVFFASNYMKLITIASKFAKKAIKDIDGK